MRCRFSLSFVVAGFILCGIATDALAVGKACALITQQAAAAIYGAPVQAGVEDDHGAAGTDCIFSGTGAFSVGVIDLKSVGIPPAIHGNLFQPSPGYTNTQVAGLGERAVFTTMAAPADSTVWVLFRSKTLVLDAKGSNNPNVKAALIAAAKQILGKL